MLSTLVVLVADAPALAQDSGVAIARIEWRQSPNRQGLDPLTLQEVMQKYRVPGVSVAVIKDFELHWAKGYGVADVEGALPATTVPIGDFAVLSWRTL